MTPALVALVVHDLKNALGHLEARLALLEHSPDPAAAREAHQQCRTLRQRFVMFLTLHGVDGEAGRDLAAWRSDESPLDFLHGLMRRITPAPGATAPLSVVDDGQAPVVWEFDPRLVGLALEAALHNAWRFARSRIEMGAREEGGRLVLWIGDDGPGLGSADPQAVTDTGLGTELCRAVARAHGGEVRLFDRPAAHGGGAQFELWLT